MPYKDPIKLSEYKKTWARLKYRKDPEKARTKSRAYRKANPSRYIESVKTWQRNNPKKSFFITKKAQAKLNGVVFTLKFDDIYWPSHCPVLGLELSYERYRGLGHAVRDYSPSFDRLDNSKGYETGNVLIVSHKANRLRSNASTEDLRKVADFYSALLGQ